MKNFLNCFLFMFVSLLYSSPGDDLEGKITEMENKICILVDTFHDDKLKKKQLLDLLNTFFIFIRENITQFTQSQNNLFFELEKKDCLIAFFSQSTLELDSDLNRIKQLLVQSDALNVLFEKDRNNLTNELGKVRADYAVAKKDLADWNKLKIFACVGGAFACCVFSYFVLRLYKTLFTHEKDIELDKELEELADNYNAWVENSRFNADPRTKDLYLEFDTANIKKSIREGSSPIEEFLKIWKVHGDIIRYMSKRLIVNLQYKELLASLG